MDETTTHATERHQSSAGDSKINSSRCTRIWSTMLCTIADDDTSCRPTSEQRIEMLQGLRNHTVKYG